MRNHKIKLVAILIFTVILVVPILGNKQVTNGLDLEKSFQPTQYIASPSVGTIEAIVTAVDPWGGVSNAIGTIQNASHYQYPFTNTLEQIVSSQLAYEDGAVSAIFLEMNGRSVYPNGVVGTPTAILGVRVSGIIEVAESTSITDLTLVEAYSLADEVVPVYEAKLGLDFQKLGTYDQIYPYYYYDSELHTYYIVYVASPAAPTGINAMTILRTELSQLGGYMDILKGSYWPDAVSHAVEAYLPIQVPDVDNYYIPSNPDYFLSSSGYYMRILDDNAYPYNLVLQSGIMGGVFFNTPEYITPAVGEESYSLASHVGYSGAIKNKMAEDDSMNSLSAIAAAAPSDVSLNGIPVEWEVIDEDFYIPPSYSVYPAMFSGGPLSEYIEYIGTEMPAYYLSQYYQTLANLYPGLFDSTIESLWGDYPGMPPDLREQILNYDYSMITEYYPMDDINFDLVGSLFEKAGLTPTVLTEYIDEAVAEDDPLLAIIEAFLEYFDNYNILDILDDATYPNPTVLEESLNPAIEGISAVIEDLTGIEINSDLADKEAIAEFMEDHWDITLQALWDAMDAFTDNTTQIKSVVNQMIDTSDILSHFAPFMEMDIGSAITDSMGMTLVYNYEAYTFPTYSIVYHDMSSAALSLDFELDIDESLLDEPYLLVTKTPNTRSIGSGGTVTFTIDVKNLGPKTAYDIKLLDGVNPTFDRSGDYYWTHDSLNPGGTWTVTYSVIASKDGVYMDIPAICAYFNQSLDTYISTIPMTSEDYEQTEVFLANTTFTTTYPTYSTWWSTTTIAYWTCTTAWYPTWGTTYTTWDSYYTTWDTTWWNPDPYVPPSVVNYWTGSVFYTVSQTGNVITVGAGYTIWEGTVPVMIIVAGAGVAVVILVGYKLISSNVRSITRLHRDLKTDILWEK